MKTLDLYERALEPVKHWWMYLIIGILALVLGIFMLASPVITYEMLTLLLGVALIIFGIIQLVVAMLSKNFFVSRAAAIIGSILDIVLGVLLFANPGISAITLPLILGMWMGSNFILAGGDPEKLKRAKAQVKYFIIGYIVMFATAALAPIFVGALQTWSQN